MTSQQTPHSNSARKEAFLGIDIGSISTKGVIINAKRQIIARSYQWTEGNPTDAARRVIAELGSQIDHNTIAVKAVGTTGSARRLVGAMCGASVIKNEITAHAVGTTYLHPDVRTILEIGGQDSKIICVDGGIAIDYAMNTLCAAGTGAFLSSQAHRLGVEVEQFGEIALTSKKPLHRICRKRPCAQNPGRVCAGRHYCRPLQIGSRQLPEQCGQREKHHCTRRVPRRGFQKHRRCKSVRRRTGHARYR